MTTSPIPWDGPEPWRVVETYARIGWVYITPCETRAQARECAADARREGCRTRIERRPVDRELRA